MKYKTVVQFWHNMLVYSPKVRWQCSIWIKNRIMQFINVRTATDILKKPHFCLFWRIYPVDCILIRGDQIFHRFSHFETGLRTGWKLLHRNHQEFHRFKKFQKI